MDPFATPVNSRPSSREALPSTSTNYVPRRSIFVQSGFGSPAFSSSARQSMVRVSSSGQLSTTSITQQPAKSKIPRMKSHMLNLDEPVEKPWLVLRKSPRAAFSYYIVYVLVFIATAAGIVQSFFRYKSVPLDTQPLCLVFEENFDNEQQVFGTDPTKGGSFFREVSMDGFGNGEFEMTTSSSNNSFLKNGHLYLNPTLTSLSLGSDSAVYDGTTYNITDCTFNLTAPDAGYITSSTTGKRVFDEESYLNACSKVSNNTAGTVINPVMSARVSTRFSASIRYGRVEVRAKMPNGDWMWPAIWMLPKDSVYGPWPRSGEIDIVESRGNSLRYTAMGSNYVQGTLNWGPSPSLNSFSKTYSWWTDKRQSFGSGFHTYALEWTDKFLRIYVDSRLRTLLEIKFDKSFFQRGEYPSVIFNGSSPEPLTNPWVGGNNASPFDQEFYLIMNVAVGGTSGWFPEGQGDKPWLDRADHPMRDFAKATPKWYTTWPSNVDDRAMVVDYVKMWKHC